MEFFKSPSTKIPLRNGLIAGLLGFIVLLVLYFIGKHPFLFNVFFDFRIILFAIFMVITLREIRDAHQEGILFFWQGMIACLMFTIAFAVVTFFLIFIFTKLYPAFLSTYISLAIEQYKALPAETIERIGRKVYDEGLKVLPNTTGYDMAKRYFWQNFILSFFVSIIISVILRRQPKTD
jgi:Protein of unknown function (DUF4199)